MASVKNKVMQLNRSGKLCSEIDLNKVGTGLAQLSEPIALQLLKASNQTQEYCDAAFVLGYSFNSTATCQHLKSVFHKF